ncbi:trissin receptor-like [Dermacentor andersoni]|uniref:trissin receptor-like n=1 Tax=Dermacentor andersoni TaxID=34620 RepID=UPI0021556AA8|nr:trissin receptor-like [Dermacentor andersoni]
MDTSCREQLAGLDSTLPPSELLGNCTGLPGFLNDSCCPLAAEEPGDGWIFDRFDVKVILVIAYSMVFCCCFFGNLLVIGVVITNRRMRTTTNFFLTNLAVADLCVAMFCVYQNLFFYLTPQWVLGDFLCRMYFFVHGLSYTASILILTVICAERYLAIVHPMLNKQVVTMTRLRVTIVTVWFVSAAYCSPRIVMYGTVEAVVDDKREALCVLQRALYDSKTYDLVNFVVCFLVPLIIITVLYAIICYQLWHSQAIVSQPQNHIAAQMNHQLVLNSTLSHQKSHPHQRIAGTPPNHRRSGSEEDSESPPPVDSKLEYAQTFVTASSNTKEPCSTTTIALTMPYSSSTQRIAGGQQLNRVTSGCSRCGSVEAPTTPKVPVKTFYYANSAAASALRPRRKVIRLLVAVVFSFALCNLPFHARKLWQHWSPEYNGSSPGAAILTVVTNLVLYLNSGLNPFLYALFSKNFRQCMADVLFCRNQRFRSKSRSSFQAMSKSLNSNVSLGTPQAARLARAHRKEMQQQHL